MPMPKMWTLVLIALLSALSLQAQAPYRNPPAQEHGHDAIDPALLIAAKDAYELHQKRQALFVDVRSRFEYNAEHIQHAISFPYKAISVAHTFPFPKDKPLIMYCGCPHHLSGMSAEILKKKGYAQVKVINEGYWGWKQMGYPIIVGIPEAIKRISQTIEGRLINAQDKPLAGQDVFVEHLPTGQLEATRTDKEGRFRMQLHFAGVQVQERLRISVRQQPLAHLTLKEMETPLTLRLTQSIQ